MPIRKHLLLPHQNSPAETFEGNAAERRALVRTLTKSACVAALIAGCIAIGALAAALLNGHTYAFSVWPAMRPATAICTLLSAVFVFILQRPRSQRSRLMPLLSVTVGAFLLLLLAAPQVGGESLQDAMPLYTALTLLLLQIGIVAGYFQKVWGRRVARLMGGAVIALGLGGLLGVVFRVLLNMPPLVQLSAPGGIAIMLLGYGVLVGRSDEWLAEQFTSTRPSAILVRRLLPVVVLLPMLLALGCVWAQHAGWMDSAVGILFIMVCTVVLFTVFVLWTARMIEKAEGARETAQRVADAQREWLRVTMTSISDAVVATDAEGRIRILNPAAEALIGADENELRDRELAGILVLSGDDGGPPAAEDRVHAQAPRIYNLRRADGSEGPVEASSAPIRAADGSVLGSVLVLRDVSERQKNERALRTAYAELDARVAERTAALQQANAALHETLTLFRGVAESTPDLIVVKDVQGRILMANPATLKALGRSETDILGRSVKDLVDDPHLAARAIEHDQRVISSGKVERAEQVLPTSEGIRTYLSTKSPLRDVNGEVVGLITVATDITDRKRIENDLREAQRFTQGLLDTAPLVLYLIDLGSGRIVFASGMVLPALGYSADELLSMETDFLIDLVHPDDRPALRGHAQSYASEPYELKNIELRFRHRDGDWRWLHCRERLFEAAATTRLALGVAIDVTDRRQAERELEQLISAEQRLRLEAERANRAKDEFLAIVSHELRSPLNALRGWSFLLGNSKDPDASLIERATQAIKRNVDHQARLIDDLLDTSRIMSGKLTLERRPLNLVEAVNSAIEVVRPAATAKRITVEHHAADSALGIDGDPARLHQIAVNLLTNAVKFTPEEGRIDVTTTTVDDHARLIIKDSGVGIDSAFLPRVFERFSQADTSTTRKHGGLGIGLALVRHLAEMHGGRAWCESEGLGKGATFFVELPLPRSGAAPGETPAISAPMEIQGDSLSGVLICAVDDDPDARDIVNATLRRAGATVHSAASGSEFIAILDKLIPDTRPQVLLLDLAMPGEDGFAVLGHTRALERRKGFDSEDFIPAIAVTAFTDIDRSRVLEKGFSDHVAKPIDPAVLIGAIRRARRERDSV